jgi:glutamyl-Q tRNA(Asp) synthetase
MWQGQRRSAYAEALARLDSTGRLFRCDCTRAMLGPGGACAGRCLPRQGELGPVSSVRVSVPADYTVEFRDRIQGRQFHQLGREWPDFILKRKDGLDAYQLAVTVDDAAQGITHVVRGSDLMDSTPRQLFLQQLLDLPAPTYGHLPVITNVQGQKLSKQNHAPPLDKQHATENLRRALRFLRQPDPPAHLAGCRALLDSAISNWQLDSIPRALAVGSEAVSS